MGIVTNEKEPYYCGLVGPTWILEHAAIPVEYQGCLPIERLAHDPGRYKGSVLAQADALLENIARKKPMTRVRSS